MEKDLPPIDMDKLWEVMREMPIAKIDISTERLQKLKDDLVATDAKYEEVELWRLQGMLDLMNTVYVGVEKYYVEQVFGDKKLEEKKVEVVIPLNNKEWHKANKLKAFASIDEKVKWHIDHVVNCKCWPIPRNVKKEIEKRMK